MKGTTNLPYKGGHDILDTTGTALPEEAALQFADADATDDAVNEKTVVNVVRKRTQAEYDDMSAADQAKGIIHITGANAKPLFASQVRYGGGTVADALDDGTLIKVELDGSRMVTTSSFARLTYDLSAEVPDGYAYVFGYLKDASRNVSFSLPAYYLGNLYVYIYAYNYVTKELQLEYKDNWTNYTPTLYFKKM